eukprot:scaffold799_cov220-Pinguiococcus_pyrenoidosus.AAC.4
MKCSQLALRDRLPEDGAGSCRIRQSRVHVRGNVRCAHSPTALPARNVPEEVRHFPIFEFLVSSLCLNGRRG